ncbi:hypothetical protein ACWDV4_13125 [Micromonospora sp. NPDC003197]
MHSPAANGNSRLSFWQHVRRFAVPPSMIETATARRAIGDWAGACAAARVDVDLNLRSIGRVHGQEFTARLRADLRHLAPDLLRWHLPRIAPDGLLRPGVTISLARYSTDRPLHLVARTSPGWAAAGQRISLALWDESRAEHGIPHHPHPRPDRRFRFDLHRHLWDVRRSGELRVRSGADQPFLDIRTAVEQDALRRRGYAVDRWNAEAGILLRAHGQAGDAVVVRIGVRRWLKLDLTDNRELSPRITAISATGRAARLPMLPEAATWVPPDLTLLRAGLIDADQLHPLVAAAIAPGHRPSHDPRTSDSQAGMRLVECQGAQHRIGLVNGVLVPLDHDPAEIRREELLAALGGTPLPCLQMIDEAHRHPECLIDIRARLDHGDIAGALAAVEGLLGPEASLRSGSLRDELESAAQGRIAHGLYRAGLASLPRTPENRPRRSNHRTRPRHAMPR